MDRFIDFNLGACTAVIFDLKSNMDRFIVYHNVQLAGICKNLKSNMDRFIDQRLPLQLLT